MAESMFALREQGIADQRVLTAMETVPRDRFIPCDYVFLAQADRPLPIGHGQTISQPYIVALMTELLQLDKNDRVLEIGTGSGYQTAILAELAREVYSIETIKPLADRARQTLDNLGYHNITISVANGYHGWAEKGPFDAIIVTAAPDHVPEPLIGQLAKGGRMVIPVGQPGAVQTLWRIVKEEGGAVRKESHGAVVFVPFV